jgi:signal peptidase I
MSKSKEKKSSGRPWRDNIEAVAISIVTIVLFKYFVLEAYKIPTGSMQPTLMGNPETGVFDRVLVDKFSFHYREPERYEVVVFKYPLNRAQNFIKRIIGMPGEELEIRDGDLFVRPLGDSTRGEDEGWQVLRRPRPIQDTQLRSLDTTDDWSLQGFQHNGDRIGGDGPGRAEFPRMGSVRDRYTDGYPEALQQKIEAVAAAKHTSDGRRVSGANEVSDLRVTAEVRAAASTKEVRVVLHEGKRRFRFLLPGPAAAAEARPTLEAFDPEGGMSRVTAVGPEPWRLTADESVHVLVQNLDDLLTFEVQGKEVATLEVPPRPRQLLDDRSGRVALESEGGGAWFGDVDVLRDIYYTSAGQHLTHWVIPEGHFVMLGDNPQDSSDGRDWHLTGFEVVSGPDAGTVVRGNDRPSENPRVVGNGEAALVFLRDAQGELHSFRQDEVDELPRQPAPFVPLESIVGRAVLVVWPLDPINNVYRLKWVR